MKTGYSLLVDEYVEANLAESADCDALRICCPLCQQSVVLETEAGTSRFQHAASSIAGRVGDCESYAAALSPEQCRQQNERARRRRVDFLEWEHFKWLLGKDPMGQSRNARRAYEETSKLLSQSALWEISRWHWENIIHPSPERLKDPIEFFASAERHLRSARPSFPHVPDSGLRRQVHIEVAFDLMRSLVDRHDLGDDYSWLFVHAYRICLGIWYGCAQCQSQDRNQTEIVTEYYERRATDASVLCYCGVNLLSADESKVDAALEMLIEGETEQPCIEGQIPLLALFGAEIGGEMQSTLYRLPYLPLLGRYNRPCRPALV